MAMEAGAGSVAGLTWDPPLRARSGASERLCGIRVFHDFAWLDVFSDERTQFKHGKDLARTVIQECPSTHTPALLLTQRIDVDEGFRLSDTHLLFVVNIDEYRRSRTNPALSYLAAHLRVDVAHLHGYADLADLGDPEELREAINQHLEVEDIAAWLGEDAERQRRLFEILNRSGNASVGPQHSGDQHDPPGTGDRRAGRGLEASFRAAQDALDSLTAIGHLSDDQIVQLIDFTTKLTQADHRTDLLRGATLDETGRRAATRVIHERTADRIDRDPDADVPDQEPAHLRPAVRQHPAPGRGSQRHHGLSPREARRLQRPRRAQGSPREAHHRPRPRTRDQAPQSTHLPAIEGPWPSTRLPRATHPLP